MFLNHFTSGNKNIYAQATQVTSTFQINGYIDDVNEAGTIYDEFGTTAWVGTGGSASSSFLGLRFNNINIPQGSTIVSAHFEMYSTQDQWLSIGYQTAADASGNSQAFSSSNKPSQRSLSVQKLSHTSNSQWLANTWYSSDEIKTIVQEIVNRSDWQSGNSLSLIMKGTVGTWGRKFFKTFDSSGLLAPKLVVVYEPSLNPTPTPTPTPPLVAGFQNNAVLVGLPSPTSITFTPDGRMLVTERGGRVRVLLPGNTQFEPLPFLELTNIESIVGERSLIGIALDPDFSTNNYYYVFYTAQTPLRDRVSRFTVSGNTTDLSTEQVIWEDDKVSSDIHHGGGLLFGSDGKLYISTGDGADTKPGSTHDSQTLTNFKGKVLRVNSDGTVPADNPFYDGTGPNYDAIYARGFRNPFRMSYDPTTQKIQVYDVGGGAWEEINVASAGANFGWPICEGTCSSVGMTNPLFTYSHNGGDAAIGGGEVYRGSQFPAEYQGNLFYGDFVLGWIRRLTFNANGSVNQDLAFEPPLTSTERAGSIVDVEVGPDGALYYVDIGDSIKKISYYSGNQPPVINLFSAMPTTGTGSSMLVNFTSDVTDAEGNTLTYNLEFGDGSTSAEANTTHTYTTGSFIARLIVSDGTNQTFSDPIAITIGNAPSATIDAPVNGITFKAGDVINYSGSAVDPDETLPDSAYSWTVVFHHDTHTHPAQGPIDGVKSGSFTIPTNGHDYSGNTRYEIILTVTDSQGIQDSASVTINPVKVDLTVQSNPPGIPVSLDQTTQSTPIVKDTLVAFEHTLTANPQELVNGTLYEFVSWSDVGGAIHLITAPENNQTYTANYQEVVSSLSGTVYIDSNGNGAQDIGEVGYENATINIQKGTFSQQAPTDPSGNYTFSNLSGGLYDVTLTIPAGYQASTTNPVNILLDSNTTVNFGIELAPTATPTPTPTLTPTPTPTNTPTPTPPTSGTITRQVTASTDDANQVNNQLSTNQTTVWLGTGGSASASYTGLRFTNITIPKNAQIISARLEVYSSQSQWLSIGMQIGADAIGNSPTFANSNRPSQRILTSSKVNHSSNIQWSANTWYQLDEMVPVIQEVVDRSDWNSGNSISLISKGTIGTWGRKFITSYNGSATLAPKLIITYQ